MNTLFIENDEYFTSEMLLGALIDMGASVCYIENMLENAGFKAKIYHDTVIRDGMEAEFAYVKCDNVSENIQIDNEIKKFVCGNIIFDDITNEQKAQFIAILYAINCFLPDDLVCLNYCGKNKWDREILKCVSKENNGFISGDIVCVGYGADETSILRVVLYSDGNGFELEKEEKQMNLQLI